MQTCFLVWSGEQKARHDKAMRRAALLSFVACSDFKNYNMCYMHSDITVKLSMMQQLRGVLCWVILIWPRQLQFVLLAWMTWASSMGDIISSGTSVSKPVGDTRCYYMETTGNSDHQLNRLTTTQQRATSIQQLQQWLVDTPWTPPIWEWILHHTPCGDQHWHASSYSGYYKYDCKGILWKIILIQLQELIILCPGSSWQITNW